MGGVRTMWVELGHTSIVWGAVGFVDLLGS